MLQPRHGPSAVLSIFEGCVSYKNTDSEYGTVAEESVFIKLNQKRWDARGEYRFDSGPFSALRGSYGHADYTHTEFEAVGEPGTIFNSDGWEGRADLVQRERNGWNGAVGVQALSRNFEAIGEEAFVPSVKIDELGLYTVQRLDLGNHGFEGGLRYDRRELSGTPIGGASEVTREFDNWSASAAAFSMARTRSTDNLSPWRRIPSASTAIAMPLFRASSRQSPASASAANRPRMIATPQKIGSRMVIDISTVPLVHGDQIASVSPTAPRDKPKTARPLGMN